MSDHYTLLVDESGEAGIGKIRSGSLGGASPYMTLGAVLIENRSRDTLEKLLDEIRKDFKRKSLHCSELNHYQLIHYARQIAKQRVRLFGVISRKATLGPYKSAISDDNKKYYNKCVQYLLERVGWFVETRKIDRKKFTNCI
jgi:hypothetical protein